MHQYRQSCNFIPSVRQPKLWCFPLMRRRHTNTCCWDAVLPSSRPKVCSEWKRIGLHILCPVGIPWREVLTWATGVMPKQLTKRQTVNQTERLRGKKSLIGNKAAGSNIEGQMEKETEEATVSVWEADGEKDRWQADAVEERQVQCAKLPGNCWSLVKHGKDVWDYRPALDNLVYLIREMLQKLFKNDLWWEKSNTRHRLMPESCRLVRWAGREKAPQGFSWACQSQKQGRVDWEYIWIRNEIKIRGQWKPQKLIGGFATCGWNAT